MEARSDSSHPRVVIRPLCREDLAAVQRIHRRAYPNLEPWDAKHLNSQLEMFADGQLCVEIDGKVVATSSSLIVDLDDLPVPHTYEDVCGGGFIRNHNPDGDTLYGIDIAVDPDFRGQRHARRLYDARKELAQRLNLRRIVFGGRMPLYKNQVDEISPQEYVRRAVRKEIRDPVITAQMANGFLVREVIENYLPNDKESGGHAVLMAWHNPSYVPNDPHKRAAKSMRVAAVQYQMRSVKSFEEFATQCEFFIDTAGDYRADFLVFPELLTNQLLTLVQSDTPAQSARKLNRYTERYVEFFARMAIHYNLNIIAGTHLELEKRRLYNIAYLFHRDGRIDKQYKIHITPAEARWWGVSGGREIQVFDTDCGKITIPICYDIEFPELARIARAKGAQVFFVPYNTDLRSGHIRVRSCAAARAIENHVYVIIAGAVGNLPHVEGADIHYGQSCILTPSDIHFSRDAVAAEATANSETMIIQDLDLALLRRTETTGTVHTWPDRRLDIYGVEYREGRKRVRY